MIDNKDNKLARVLKLVNMAGMLQMAPKSSKYTYSRSGEMKGDDRSIERETMVI